MTAKAWGKGNFCSLLCFERRLHQTWSAMQAGSVCQLEQSPTVPVLFHYMLFNGCHLKSAEIFPKIPRSCFPGGGASHLIRQTLFHSTNNKANCWFFTGAGCCSFHGKQISISYHPSYSLRFIMNPSCYLSCCHISCIASLREWLPSTMQSCIEQ